MRNIKLRTFNNLNRKFRILIIGTPKSCFLNSIFFVLFLTSIFYILNSSSALAADLYFSPSSGSYQVGSILSAGVYVRSSDQAMNASDGVISFPQDKLEVVSVSKAGSIFSLWVQEPSFSNTAGTVNFEGVVLNPGFTGSSAKILTVSFKIKAPGVAKLNFPSGSVLANDGQGTNILKSLGSAQFSLDSAGPFIPEATTPSVVSGTPSAPKITSSTHPDPNNWYAIKDAIFEWKAPEDIISLRLSVSDNPRSIPTLVKLASTDAYNATGLSEGIHYFHLQFRNAKGWGEVSHFRVQIDTERPTHFNLTEIPRTDSMEPEVKFIFDSRDETSGVDHYEIQIDNGDSITWKDDKSKTYTSPVLGFGEHTFIAKAVDKAGNFLISAAKFTIQALEPPKITEYPKELSSKETLIAKGNTYPNSKVKLWLQKGNAEQKSFIVKSDSSGKFTYVSDEIIQDGIYKLWAEVEDERGARSGLSDKFTIRITQVAFFRIGSLVLSFFALIIPLLALLIVIAMLIWYSLHKYLSLRKRIRKEAEEAENALSKSFKSLKEEIWNEISKLEEERTDGKPLTKREEGIIDDLKKSLDSFEKIVGKEVKDIGEELDK